MRSVAYSQIALDGIEAYIMQYRRYFHETYSDTGIWAESKILESYTIEAQDRKQEILHLINERLSSNEVLGRAGDSMAIFRWRSKYLFVTWDDMDNTRIVTGVQVR